MPIANIFLYQLLAPYIIMICYHLKLSPAHSCTFTQITTQLSEGPTISSQFLWVRCLPLSHQEQSSVNDCPQMIHSVFCSVSVTGGSLLLYLVLCQWQFAASRYALFLLTFCVFHSVCLHLFQLYSQYFTISTSYCSCSQSTLNTATHCLKDCCCVMIGDCW
jgi:hypothetical protein